MAKMSKTVKVVLELFAILFLAGLAEKQFPTPKPKQVEEKPKTSPTAFYDGVVANKTWNCTKARNTLRQLITSYENRPGSKENAGDIYVNKNWYSLTVQSREGMAYVISDCYYYETFTVYDAYSGARRGMFGRDIGWYPGR